MDQEPLRSLLEACPVAVARLDREGRYREINPAVATMLGRTADAIVGKRLDEVGLPEPVARLWKEKHDEVLATQRPAQFRSDRHVAHFVPDGDDVLASCYEDPRAVLAETEDRFEKAFRQNPLPMAITHLDGRVVDVNDRYVALFGFTAEESRGQLTVDLGMWVDPPTHQALLERVAAEGSLRSVPVELVTKSGETRALLLSAEMITLAGARCLLSSAIDVTDYKRLQEELLQAQKLEALGRLAGGVAHDFNNLLAVVSSCADVCLRRTRGDDPAVRENLEAIRTAAQRGGDLTRQLLAVGKKQVLRPSEIDLRSLVRGFEPLIRPILGDDIALAMKLPQTPAPVKADPVQLEQVVMNLVVNARDAMPAGGALTIEVEDDGARWVALRVSDTGEGMADATRAHIFEPFFTTKGDGKGSGLGLATVHGIVEQSGGDIDVASAPGRGAAFTVRLPRV